MELKDTEKRLLAAVSSVLQEDGFSKIGVNRIAKTAGCDKVLIYRYFGGLDGLLSAWAKEHDFYSFAYEQFAERIEHSAIEDFQQIAEDVLFGQLEFIRAHVLMQELLVWELSGNSSFQVIREEREKNGYQLQLAFEKRFGLGAERSRMYMTLLIASINYIVLFTRQYPLFNGIDFSQESSWQLMREAIQNYINSLFKSILR